MRTARSKAEASSLTPVNFEQANVWLNAPAGWEDNKENPPCGVLPVCRITGALPQHISCWKLTLRQRLTLLFKGKVWLQMVSTAHPPVALLTESPFIEP